MAFFLGFIIVFFLIPQSKADFEILTAQAESIVSSSLDSSNTNSSSNLNNGILHVIIIIMENKGYTEVIGSPDAPYQNELAKKYSSASKYFGVYPDSLPNYISIIAGYPYLTKDKDPGTMTPLKNSTIVNLLQSKNLTWKGYFEDTSKASCWPTSGLPDSLTS